MQTVTRKKIEILTDEPLVPRILAALQDCGVGGHTLLPALSGSGHTGRWHDERLTGATKVMLMTIVSADDAARLVDRIGPLLDSHRLLLTIADVEVVRGDRF